MILDNFNSQIKNIFYGNVFLIVCSLVYLLWWIVTFKPGNNDGTLSMRLLIAAFSTGIIGLILTVKGINTIPHGETIVPGKYILIGGIIAYAVLLIFTYIILRRQVTTELFLIVGWSVLELIVVNVLYGAGRYLYGTAVVLFAVIIIAAALSLVCYILYYNLKGAAGYIDGMIPLIIVAAVMSLMDIMIVI